MCKRLSPSQNERLLRDLSSIEAREAIEAVREAREASKTAEQLRFNAEPTDEGEWGYV